MSAEDNEYETVWNGTMERQRQHPGLSRMTGPSSTMLAMNLPEAVDEERGTNRPGETRRHMSPETERRAVALLRRGYTSGQTASNLGLTAWQLQTLRKKFGILRRKV